MKTPFKNTLLESWEIEYYERHPKPIPLEDCEVGDLVRFVDSSGNIDESTIVGIIPMMVRNKKEHQILLMHPRTKTRRDLLYSNIRIEKILEKGKQQIKENDRLQDNSRFYYLLRG